MDNTNLNLETNISLLGNGIPWKMNATEVEAVTMFLNLRIAKSVPPRILQYPRIHLNKIAVHSLLYKGSKQRNNAVVKFGESYGVVRSFFQLEDEVLCCVDLLMQCDCPLNNLPKTIANQ